MRVGKLAGAIAVVGVAAAFAPASANADINLSFEGSAPSPGTEPPLGGPVNSFSWGVNSPGAAVAGPDGGPTGRRKFQQVTLTKPVDSNSPIYPLNLATNNARLKAQIFFEQPNSVDGLALCMEGVSIMEYELNDEANPGDGPDNLTETMTLNYSKISYVIYLDGGPFNVTFDLKRGGVRFTTENPCPTNT